MTFHNDAHQLGGLESRHQDPSKQVLDKHVLLTGDKRFRLASEPMCAFGFWDLSWR